MKEPASSLNESEVSKLLMEVGLTETEAHLYRCGYEIDSITVQELCKQTGIKRPTIYHALHTLTEKGLVAEQQRDGKIHFRMQPPAHLLGWVEHQKEQLVQKEDAVQSLVKQLATRALSGTASLMQVTHYDDAKNIQAVFDLAFYARSKRCVLIFPSEAVLSQLDADSSRVQDAKKRDIDVHVEIRKNISSALVIYDDTVMLIPEAQPLTATVITLPALAATLSNLF